MASGFPEREAREALITETQRDVTGLVRLKLYKGNIIVAAGKSSKSLYDSKIATMEAVHRRIRATQLVSFV
jgi:argininosuccinate synthase